MKGETEVYKVMMGVEKRENEREKVRYTLNSVIYCLTLSSISPHSTMRRVYICNNILTPHQM